MGAGAEAAVVAVQVGQCGNQLGPALLDALYGAGGGGGGGGGEEGVYFREGGVGGGVAVARAVLVDAEPKAVAEAARASSRRDTWRYAAGSGVAGQGGSGNCWARGYYAQPALTEAAVDAVRKEVERADCPAGVAVIGSVAGGTGSGLGCRIAEAVAESLSLPAFSVSVAPYAAGGSDVAVQSYNALLSISHHLRTAAAISLHPNDKLQAVAMEALGAARPGMPELNVVCAHSLASVMAAPDAFTDVLHHACAHPAYRLLTSDVFPGPKGPSGSFSLPTTWPAVINRLRQTVANANRGEHQNWPGPNKCVANVIALHGRGADAADVSAFADPALYAAWSVDPMQSIRCLAPYAGNEVAAGVISNSQAGAALLSRMLPNAYAMLQANAFVHQFTQHGMDRSELEESFAIVEDTPQSTSRHQLVSQLEPPALKIRLINGGGNLGVGLGGDRFMRVVIGEERLVSSGGGGGKEAESEADGSTCAVGREHVEPLMIDSLEAHDVLYKEAAIGEGAAAWALALSTRRSSSLSELREKLHRLAGRPALVTRASTLRPHLSPAEHRLPCLRPTRPLPLSRLNRHALRLPLEPSAHTTITDAPSPHAAAAAAANDNDHHHTIDLNATSMDMGCISVRFPAPRQRRRRWWRWSSMAAARGREREGAAAALGMKKKLKSDGEVLKGVQKLAASMAAAAVKEGSRTLADLGLQGVREVKEVSTDDVVALIEAALTDAAAQIVAGEGLTWRVPSRAAGNQLYVKELDRIVLKDKESVRPFANTSTVRKATITARVLQLIHQLSLKRIHVTKRDLFYTDVKLFVEQGQSDAVLEDVSCMLGCTRSSLSVVASEKGVVVGRLQFDEDGDTIDCTRMGIGGKAIPPNLDRVNNIRSDATFILLVEKDAAFMRLAEDRFYNRFPCIILTAKGQPDVATRLFLRRLKLQLRIPVLGLVDADPYGLKILSVYMSGSKNMSYDSANLTTPDIKWLGVRPSDLNRYHIPEQCRLPMTDTDIKTGRELLQEEFISSNPAWHKELDLMVRSKEKAEIQALSSFGFQYLSEVYLPLKLQEMDWI
eukprot:jgi/Chlat1/634/Chrsp103S01049